MLLSIPIINKCTGGHNWTLSCLINHCLAELLQYTNGECCCVLVVINAGSGRYRRGVNGRGVRGESAPTFGGLNCSQHDRPGLVGQHADISTTVQDVFDIMSMLCFLKILSTIFVNFPMFTILTYCTFKQYLNINK